MPKKIDFTVIHVSSEDPKYRSTELNSHGPAVRGWQSVKNCDYPQEIILKLEKKCSLRKIQLLIHQFLIPAKVELFSSNEDTNADTDIDNIVWDYLGYITLSDNQITDFKSRELKSANVPTTIASYIKLNLGNNHFNSHNTDNQVSLIAVNILGNDLESRKYSNPDTASINDKLNAIINDPEYISPYDDLSFEMYVDTEIAKIIKEMEIKKYLAVLSERFEYARKLKVAMENLRPAGEKLGKYDLEKRHAIEKEDYEKARHKKSQADEFRNTIYAEICVEQLLETNGVCSKNDDLEEEPEKVVLTPKMETKRATSPIAANHHQPPPPLMRHQSPKWGSPASGSPNMSRNSFRRRNKSGGKEKSTFELYEDKPLPALRHSQTNEFLRECQLDGDLRTTSKLTEREKKQAALPILVFGAEIVEQFYSKHYCDKEDGLNNLKENLLTYDNSRLHTANKTGRAAIFLLHRALRDKVFTVYSLANEVIRLYFVQFVPSRVSQPEVARSVDKLLPELLTKSGDTSARMHHMAVHTILTMADCKSVRDLHIIPNHLTRTVNSSTHPRLALSRAEMVEQLILNHGISNEKQSGLTCRTLSEFGSSGLHHPAESVRKVSERILVLVYKINPRLVRKQLPPDDDITRRNLLYRQLFHEFDRIDLQRKHEMIEKHRLMQQFPPTPTNNGDCYSPIPTPTSQKRELGKCTSSTNINASLFGYEQNLTLNKSYSGGNLSQNNESKSSSSTSGISTPSNSIKDEEKKCIFCNQTESSILSVSNSMNSHYWRACPMLVRCKECSQVVEVSALVEHLLVECEHRENYKHCSLCSGAVKIDELQLHQCTPLEEGFNRCPLCLENLLDEPNCWKTHLMGDKPCMKNNKMVKSNSQKTVKIQV